MALPVGQSLHLPRRGDGSIWTPDRYVPPTGSYDLYLSDNKSRGLIPFAVNPPLEPDTSANGTVVVSNQGQLDAANQNGTRIVVQPGTYTINNWGGQDKWFDLQPGAVMNGTVVIGNYLANVGHARIKITGGTINGDLIVDGVTDLLVDGTTWNGYSNVIGRAWEVVRMAVLNCDITDSEYGIGMFRTGTGPWTDLIVAGNRIQSGSTATSVPIRIQGVDRAIIVDNYLIESSAAFSFRVHDHCDNVWIRNNVTTPELAVYSPNHTTDDGIRTLGRVWAYDNVHYMANGGAGPQLFDYPRFEQAVIVGTRVFSPSYGAPTAYNPFSGYATGPGWSQSDNVADAYSSPSWPGPGVPLY